MQDDLGEMAGPVAELSENHKELALKCRLLGRRTLCGWERRSG